MEFIDIIQYLICLPFALPTDSKREGYDTKQSRSSESHFSATSY